MADDSGRGVQPETDDPIRYLDALTGSPIVTVWRYASYPEHFHYRVGEQSGRTATVRSRLNYDHLWTCNVCHPYKEKRERARIIEAFAGYANGGVGYEMWVSVVATDDVGRACRKARRRGLSFVAVPVIMGHEYVVLTTGALFDDGGSEQAWDFEEFVRRTLMPLRWEGRLRSTRGFLPPDRVHEYWETYHPGTGRRCWDLHATREEAEECREDIAAELNETTRGWYIRGVSEWRSIGQFRVTGARLRELLDEVGLMSLMIVTHDQRAVGDPVDVVFGPIEWEDRRFVELRRRAGWVQPANFSPPPIAVTIRVDVDRGKMTGTR